MLLSCANLHAQVTIGGTEIPKAGTLLDLNSNVKGGLVLSNVTILDLEKIPQETNVFEGITDVDINPDLRGAIVYNNGQGTTVPAGIYVWNGYCWTKDGNGTTIVTVPSISIEGAVTSTYSVVEGDSVTFTVVLPQAGVNYSWYKNISPSISGGTPVNTGLTCNTPTDLAEGIHYYYCMATSDACPSLYATSSLLSITVNNLHSLPVGSGALAGRACFDVMTGNSGAGCGTTITRQPFSADFTQPAVNTQEYIFSPSGTVSRLRFYVEENQTYSEQIIESLDYNRALKTQDDISGEQKFSIVYKNNLNETAKGTDNYNALILGIHAVYNDARDGSGTDKAVKLTALIKDCQCCGAYLNTAQTRWLNFSCHNLDATESVDPFTPAAALHGAKYKWGIASPAMNLYEDQNQPDYADVNDWSSRGTPPGTSNIDWDMETANPCPSG
jgi:hypothetical protein